MSSYRSTTTGAIASAPRNWDAAPSSPPISPAPLLPWLRLEWAATGNPASTIVAGCSLGGSTACYLALTAPHTFGCAVSLSGSFWWPGSGPGVPFQDRVRATPASGSRFDLEVGALEWMLVEPNRDVRDLLRETGHHVRYRKFCGGHDVLH